MNSLQLIDHPEGGRYLEVFRSPVNLTTVSGERRSALTHIYFSLRSGEHSRFHRVDADEVWNLYHGSGLRLFLYDDRSDGRVQSVDLSPSTGIYCHVVPAGVWQAAQPLDAEILAGCSVAPGFEFSGFTLLAPATKTARALLASAPDLEFLTRPCA